MIGAVMLVSAVAAPGSSGAAEPPSARPLGPACPADRMLEVDGFADMAGSLHEQAAACLSLWGIAGGTQPGMFGSLTHTSRAQMATLLDRLVRATGGMLPADPPDAFDDDDGSVHEPAINALAAAGVIEGVGPRKFNSGGDVTRGQMATLIVRVLDHLAGEAHTTTDDYFTDDSPPHETSINVAASLGVVTGTGPGIYEPNAPITRAATASIVGRALSYQVEGTALTPPPHTAWQGRAVAVRDYRDLVVYDFSSGATTLVYSAALPNIIAARPSPRGDRILFHEYWDNEVKLVRTDGTGLRTFSWKTNSASLLKGSWAPDGRRFVGDHTYAKTEVAVLDADTGTLRVLTGSSSMHNSDFAWSPRGHSIFVAGGDDNDPMGAPSTGRVRTIRATDGAIQHEHTTPIFGNDGAWVKFSPRPDRALFGGFRDDGTGYGVVADPRSLEVSHELEQYPGWAVWSPGGSRAVWQSYTDDYVSVTHILDARTGEVRVVDGFTEDSSFAWSPDGTTLIAKECRKDPNFSGAPLCDRAVLIDAVTGDILTVQLSTGYDSWAPIP